MCAGVLGFDRIGPKPPRSGAVRPHAASHVHTAQPAIGGSRATEQGARNVRGDDRDDEREEHDVANDERRRGDGKFALTADPRVETLAPGAQPLEGPNALSNLVVTMTTSAGALCLGIVGSLVMRDE
jgi:hypothetical protein